MQKPGLVSSPRFSVSAICHISPSTCGFRVVRSKKGTARSPVMTPSWSVSARVKRYANARFSSAERFRTAGSMVELACLNIRWYLGLRRTRIIAFGHVDV